MSSNKDEGRLVRLVDMKPLLRVNVDSTPICPYENCANYGGFEECYTHVHSYCEVFDEWYDTCVPRPFCTPLDIDTTE